MTSEHFEFTDINSETKLAPMIKGRTSTTTNIIKNGGGCFVSTAVGLFLIILGVLLAVAVGLIVYFAVDGRDALICKCDSSGTTNAGVIMDPAAIKDWCRNFAKSGDSEICSKCPTAPSKPPAAKCPTPAPSNKPPSSTKTEETVPPKRFTDVRLPRSVTPIHYDVRLHPYMYTEDPEDFIFKGHVHIRMKCVEATQNLTLHAHKLTMDTDAIQVTDSTTGSDVSLQDTDVDEKRDFFILRFSEDLRKEEEYDVYMNFSAPLEKGLSGLYLSFYKRGNKTVYLATSQFEPTDARKAFPCFDEPAIKATFNITLVRKSDLISISNTPIINTETWIEGGVDWVADIYEQTPKMSAYLLAFIVCDFHYTVDTADNGVVYRAFARPEVKNSTLYALEFGVKVLPYFERYFNTSYPMSKQDMIAIPDFASGAQENWGLITYRESTMLYTEGVSNEASKEWVAAVVAHEVAHQWFGDLVTPAWWDDLWLKEGFASFWEYMGVDYVHPTWNMWDVFVTDTLQQAFILDGLATSHPIYVPVFLPEEINEIYDDIAYSKGASIIRMMSHFLGPETFREALVRYLHENPYGAVSHDDLWTAMTEQAASEGKDHLNVKEIMDTWTLQMNYPVVTVTRDFNDLGVLHVTQDRYLVDGDAKDSGEHESEYNYLWTIPLTLTSSQNPDFVQNDSDVYWIYKDERSTTIRLGRNNLPAASDPKGWILCNTGQNGFYRVNYQVGNWKALIHQLETDHTVIPVINRAQIINDAWNLAKPGLLDIEVALNTSNYLHKELSYIPWRAAIKELSFVGRMLSLTSSYGMYRTFLREKIEEPFQHFSLNNTGASHVETYARVEIASMACFIGLASCANEAVKQYREWMNDEQNNRIDPNLKPTVYCTAIRHGDWVEWEFALMMYKEAETASEKEILLQALTCTTKQWILHHYLSLTLENDNSPIRKQDVLDVLRHVGMTIHGRALAWQFYRQHYDSLSEYFSSLVMWPELIGDLTRAFNTEYQLSELMDLKNKKSDKLGASKRAFEQAVETVRNNMEWMDRNYPTVQAWLSNTYD